MHLYGYITVTIIHASSIGHYRYWWRALSSAFLLRPNKNTLALMDYHRTLKFNAGTDQCVSVYIRRGKITVVPYIHSVHDNVCYKSAHFVLNTFLCLVGFANTF